MEREKLLKLSVLAAKASGKILLKKYASAKILGEKGTESTYELVTEADIMSEKAILKSLSKANVPILSEETKNSTEIPEEGFCFAVDPLDGTFNYSMKLPFFSVSIGILEDRKPIGGAILNPATGELFSALSGRGAYLNGKRISVSKNRDISRTLINHCHRQGPGEIEQLARIYERAKKTGRDFRRLGSGALDLAWVASGRNDIFFTIGFGGLWDVIAGVAIVREAGGIVSDFSGKEWTIGEKNLLAVNNSEMQKKAIELLQSLNAKDNMQGKASSTKK